MLQSLRDRQLWYKRYIYYISLYERTRRVWIVRCDKHPVDPFTVSAVVKAVQEEPEVSGIAVSSMGTSGDYLTKNV